MVWSTPEYDVRPIKAQDPGRPVTSGYLGAVVRTQLPGFTLSQLLRAKPSASTRVSSFRVKISLQERKSNVQVGG